MMKKKIMILLLSGLCLFSLSACKKEDEEPTRKPTEEPITSMEKEETNSKEEPGDPKEPQQESVSYTNLEDSISLTDYFATTNENIMFSPTSLNYALGMICEGAEGDSRIYLEEYLDDEDYTSHAKEYLEHISTFSNSTLEIANGLWLKQGYTWNEEYKTKIEQAYDAKLESLDFSKQEETAETINTWAEEKTKNQIHYLVVPELITPDTCLFVTNTVYFEAPWIDPWSQDENHLEAFTLFDNTTQQLSYLYHSADAYYENEQAVGFCVNYPDGISFLGILPKKQGPFTLQKLNIPKLLETKNYDFSVLNVKMPAFCFDSNLKIDEGLKDLGYEWIFSEYASFPYITDENLRVDSILQKTRCEVDKDGTIASAATVISMAKCSMEIPDETKRKEIYLDRPFAFLIYDETMDEILFIGKVTDPTKE